VIVSAALCPCTPLLARVLTGQADVLPDLRAACAAAVAALLATRPDAVAVVGPAEPTASWDPAARLELSAYAPALARREPQGTDNGGRRVALPLSLGIGKLLLDEAGHAGPRTMTAVAESEPPDECARLGHRLARLPAVAAGQEQRVALLVMGDGTARRSVSAPGYLDERAEPFDAEVERAVREGDLPALSALDPALAADLMATSRAPLQVLAAALGRSLAPAARPRARVLYCAAPFGVAYLVATVVPVVPALAACHGRSRA
jgi:hypothetical protein